MRNALSRLRMFPQRKKRKTTGKEWKRENKTEQIKDERVFKRGEMMQIGRMKTYKV